MKKITLAIIFAFCALSLVAQHPIRVNYRGATPTITDLAWAFFNDIENDEEECGDRPALAVKEAWSRYLKNLPQEEGTTFTLDEKNGYVFYEYIYNSNTIRMEMCYWNESDGKHKLFAFNNMASFDEDGPIATETSGIYFFRYDNAKKRMTYCYTPGFVVDYQNTYALPRAGKDIVETKWNADGTKTETILKWDGHKFNR